MKVFFDCKSLFYYPTGMAVYTAKLLKALTKMPAPPELSTAYATLNFQVLEYLKKNLEDIVPSVTLNHIRLPGRLANLLPFLSKYFSAPSLPQYDIVHATNYTPPAWARGSKFVLTIHDLGFLRYPEKKFSMQSSLKNSVVKISKRADLIVTDSQFSKKEIVELLNFSQDKVFVAPLGSQWENIEIPPNFLKQTLKKYGLKRKTFFLAVGRISPRKNYAHLIESFHRFQQDHPKSHLVIVGPYGWSSEDVISLMETSDNILWLNNCPQEDLLALYHGAKAHFLISWYEGFGIPLLEAMQVGCPSCYSTGSCLDELAQGAGLAVDPANQDQIEQAFHSLWLDENLCQSLSEKGQKQARKFSWSLCAQETLKAYQFVMNQ